MCMFSSNIDPVIVLNPSILPFLIYKLTRVTKKRKLGDHKTMRLLIISVFCFHLNHRQQFGQQFVDNNKRRGLSANAKLDRAVSNWSLLVAAFMCISFSIYFFSFCSLLKRNQIMKISAGALKNLTALKVL